MSGPREDDDRDYWAPNADEDECGGWQRGAHLAEGTAHREHLRGSPGTADRHNRSKLPASAVNPDQGWQPTADDVTAFWHHTEDVIAEFTPEPDAAFYHRLAVYMMGVEAARALAVELMTERDT